MTLNKTERNQLAQRIMVLYHRVLVDIRNWIYEDEIDVARDAADYLEPLVIDYSNLWLEMNKEEILADIHRNIGWFVNRHHTRYYYYEIFDLPYEEFAVRYLSKKYVEITNDVLVQEF
jgi:hypothetical protein